MESSELLNRIAMWRARLGDVTICAVTKTVPAETVNIAYDAGIRLIGENRVQELRDKRPELRDGFEIHLIGRLQTNKARKALELASLIQSLDRAELAEELDRQAEKLGIVARTLVQVNIAREPQKAGVAEESLEDFLLSVGSLPHLRVEGLMAVMPMAEDAETVRPYFRSMRALFDEYAKRDLPGVEMKTLSMGMSGDCVVAAEEGATMVRIGSALFGKRI